MKRGNVKKAIYLALLLLLVGVVVMIIMHTLGTKTNEMVHKWESKTQEKGEGTVMVKGIGQDLYFVFDKKGEEKIGFKTTGEKLELPAGIYNVGLNGVSCKVTIRPDEEIVLESQTLLVEGEGLALYSIHDSSGKKKLHYRSVGAKVEMFPGSYIVILHGAKKQVDVTADSETVLKTGILLVKGDGIALYEVYDSEGMNKYDYRSINKEMVLFPGEYTVRYKDKESKSIVEADQKTVIDFTPSE